MKDLVSGSYKGQRANARRDTRNNWIAFMFVSKYRYNVFRKQSTIDACTMGFRELEAFGFRLGEIGYGGTHVHGLVDVPKGYSVQEAEIMLKSHAAQRIFAEKPNFRKLYPKGTFWSGYEHHRSVGADRGKTESYIRSQQSHHNVTVINDTQRTLKAFVN